MGNVLAGVAIILGLIALTMGATGSYAMLDQFGINLPGAPETTKPVGGNNSFSGGETGENTSTSAGGITGIISPPTSTSPIGTPISKPIGAPLHGKPIVNPVKGIL